MRAIIEFLFPRRRRNSLDLTEISVEIVDTSTQPVATRFEELWLTFVEYFSCELTDPFIDMPKQTFQDDHPDYKAFYRLFHVKRFAFFLLGVKALAYFGVTMLVFVLQSSAVLQISVLVVFATVIVADLVLLIGVITRDISCFLPFFILTVLFAITAAVRFFVEFLDLANVRAPIDSEKGTLFAFHVIVIGLELYSLAIVWQLFNYVNDRLMCEELGMADEEADPVPFWRRTDTGGGTSSDDEDGESLAPMTRQERRHFRVKWLSTIKSGGAPLMSSKIRPTLTL